MKCGKSQSEEPTLFRFALRLKMPLTPSRISRPLAPTLQVFKTQVESILRKQSDVVLFSKNIKEGGITDLAFEVYKKKKRVSLYFKSDKQGIKAYRDTAAIVKDFSGVDLKYTPQYGQSRISFNFDDFFSMLNESKMLLPFTTQTILEIELGEPRTSSV